MNSYCQVKTYTQKKQLLLLETTKGSNIVVECGKKQLCFPVKVAEGEEDGTIQKKAQSQCQPRHFVTVHFSQTDKAAVQRAPCDQRLEFCWINKTSSSF